MRVGRLELRTKQGQVQVWLLGRRTRTNLSGRQRMLWSGHDLRYATWLLCRVGTELQKRGLFA